MTARSRSLMNAKRSRGAASLRRCHSWSRKSTVWRSTANGRSCAGVGSGAPASGRLNRLTASSGSHLGRLSPVQGEAQARE